MSATLALQKIKDQLMNLQTKQAEKENSLKFSIDWKTRYMVKEAKGDKLENSQKNDYIDLKLQRFFFLFSLIIFWSAL